LKKVLLALTAAAVLCSSATAATTASPAAYRAQANAICAKGVAQLNAIPQPKTASGLLPYFQKVASMGDKLLLKIAAVTPPTGLQPSVARAIKLQAAFETGLHGLIAKLRTSSNAKQTVLAAEPKLTSLNNKANVAWRHAGLAKCAG
jgi:hypothetical protein